MNKQAVAAELVRIAKSLVSVELRLQSLDGDTSILRLPIVKRGTIPEVSAWARSKGFKWIRDNSIYGGHWADPVTGEAYLVT